MNNKKCLGIEFGSTRIKAVVIDESFNAVSSSDYKWQSSYKNNIWTYDLEDVLTGLKEVVSKLTNLDEVSSVGISAMMHGYLAFDKDWNLLTPFRTWQNTITQEASEILSSEFNFNIPQRWSIAHLYQAILNNEEHISKIAHITTLAGYVHYLLTGYNAIGIGEASGMFPIDSSINNYDVTMLNKFNDLIAKYNLPWKIEDILPKVLNAGDFAGFLTDNGAILLDNKLKVNTYFAPCEGDAGTGMVATNAVAPKTGNVSAGTSIFSMVVLEKPLANRYEEIDIVTTPTGKQVAMVHCNNCTNDSNAWFSVFKEVVTLFGYDVSDNDLYTKLYELSLKGDPDCGNILVCNYLAGEGVTHLNEGRPLVIRKADSKFTLANLTKSMLYSLLSTLKLGMDILAKEGVEINSLTGHGGYFKTPGVGQRYLSAACNANVNCLTTASNGGAYGMALLASYSLNKNKETLEQYLNEKVFKNVEVISYRANKEDVKAFNKYIKEYKKLLEIETFAVNKF